MAARPRDKDLKGWLKRKGGRMNSWSRRWFVLKDQFLFMFLREEDKKSQDCITLDGQIILEPPPDPADPRHAYFDIVTDTSPCEQHESDKGSSPETLSLCAETEEEKKIWVRALKRALYTNKGGAVFSQSLDEILQWERMSGRPVYIPYILNECVEYLYKYGLDVEGIFRLPGRQLAIKETIARFERGQKIKFEEENTDIHVVASVLKTFLRDLPDSLIPCSLFQKFMNIALRFMEGSDESNREECVQQLTDAMKLIPKDNFIVLKYVCRFLREVGLHEPTNKMSMMSIGTVFGYNLIRHIDKENSQLFLCTADLGQNLVYMLLNFYSQVFILEYSDSGSQGNDVPTADLLRMSRIIDTPPISAMPSAYADLEGIDLTIDLSDDFNRITDCHFSLESIKNAFEYDYGSGGDDNRFYHSSDFTDEKKKRSLHLSLKECGALGRSYSTPTSPGADTPPVPPKRTKSKINRSRFISEKRKPDFKINSIERSPSDPVIPGGINTKDVLTAIAKVKVHNLHRPNSPTSSSVSTPHSYDSVALDVDPSPQHTSQAQFVTETDGKVGPSVTELRNQITSLKEELTTHRNRYKTQVTALKTQLTDMKEKYERRIETMEIEFKSQIRELENKLTNEKESCAAALASNDKLKSDITKYQMLYGDLP